MSIHGPATAMMNPLVQQWLGSVLRHALTGLGVWMMARSAVSPENWDAFVTAAVPIALGLGWAGWQKFTSRQKLVVAQALPAGASELQVEQAIKRGDAPPATLDKTFKPYIPGAEKLPPDAPYRGTAP